MNSIYLTFEEYAGYGGTVEFEKYPLYELRARKQIDMLTDGRVKAMSAVPEAVKLCMLQLIGHDVKYGAEALSNAPVVSSFTTDGYSESYGSAAEQIGTAKRELISSIRSMLSGEKDDHGVPLLYRGVVGYETDR